MKTVLQVAGMFVAKERTRCAYAYAASVYARVWENTIESTDGWIAFSGKNEDSLAPGFYDPKSGLPWRPKNDSFPSVGGYLQCWGQQKIGSLPISLLRWMMQKEAKKFEAVSFDGWSINNEYARRVFRALISLSHKGEEIELWVGGSGVLVFRCSRGSLALLAQSAVPIPVDPAKTLTVNFEKVA